MPVSYEEIQGSPAYERYNGIIFSAQRVLQCDWADRFTLWGELRYTAHPVIARAIATQCDIHPFAAANLGTGSVAAYAKARLTVTYEQITGQQQEDGSYRSEWTEPTAEFMTQSREGFRWVSDEKALKKGEEPAKLLRGLDYVVRLDNLIEVPAYCYTYAGTCNSGEISPVTGGLAHWTFAPQTLLFNPPAIENGLDEEGEVVWAATLRLTYKPNWDTSTTPWTARGWNYYWRSDAGGSFDQIEDTADNVVLNYPTADFSVI